MKVLISISLILLAFTSCKKDYTCSCTFTNTANNFEVKLEKMKKNDAKVLCEDYNAAVGSCVLK